MTDTDLRRLRVLVVVNDRLTEMALQGQLEASGIGPAHFVKTPERALADLRSWQPGLLICDHTIEPVTTLGMISEIRTDAESDLRAVPIILLGGLGRFGVLQGTLWSSGVDAVLDLPVTASRLRDCIHSLLRFADCSAGDGGAA